MNRLVLFVFCFFSVSAFGQDLTGIWRGHFRSMGNRVIELLNPEDRYKFEVQLDQKDKQFSGVTYSYKTTVFYGKATCYGTINPSTKKVLIEELKIVELRMVAGSACIMTCFLQYSKSGDEEILQGTYNSMNTTDSTDCGRGTVFLRKVPTSDFYKEPFLAEREKEAKKEPEVAKKSPVADSTEKKSSATVAPKSNKPVTTPSKDVAKKPATTKSNKPVTPPKDVAKKTATPKSNNAVTTPPKDVAKKPVTTKPSSTKPSSTQKPVVKNTPSPEAGKSNTVKIVPADTVMKIEKKPIVTPRILLTRENELVKTIATNASEITINLYDNGTIDNDTVSVYLDKKQVVTRQRLTERPISIKFALDENNMYHELVMVAENLGEIPPNTSLMVVKAGSKNYEVRITSNEQKNAVVIFKYEKE
jgi:hypothetical protein